MLVSLFFSNTKLMNSQFHSSHKIAVAKKSYIEGLPLYNKTLAYGQIVVLKEPIYLPKEQ